MYNKSKIINYICRTSEIFKKKFYKRKILIKFMFLIEEEKLNLERKIICKNIRANSNLFHFIIFNTCTQYLFQVNVIKSGIFIFYIVYMSL